MRLRYAIVFSACLLLAAPNVVSAQTPELDAYKVVESWAKALNSKNVGEIVSKYADPPMVLFFGTKSTKLATTKAEITDYFDHFVKEDQPSVVLCEHKAIKVSAGAVLLAGFYDFTLKAGVVYARYSFLMLKLDDRVWRIAHHHSAAQPMGALPCRVSQ